MWFNCESFVSYFSTDDVFFPQPSPPVTIARKIGLTPYNPKLWFTDSANSRRVSINAWEKEFTPRIRGGVSINVWKKDFTPHFRGGLVLAFVVYLAILDPIYILCSECLGTMSSQMSWSSGPMNCGSCRLQISSLWLLKCCVLWPQRIVSALDRENGHQNCRQ